MARPSIILDNKATFLFESVHGCYSGNSDIMLLISDAKQELQAHSGSGEQLQGVNCVMT